MITSTAKNNHFIPVEITDLNDGKSWRVDTYCDSTTEAVRLARLTWYSPIWAVKAILTEPINLSSFAQPRIPIF